MNQIKKYDPRFIVFYDDKILGSFCVYTGNMNDREVFYEELKTNRFVKIEDEILNTFYITKAHPLRDVDEVYLAIASEKLSPKDRNMYWNFATTGKIKTANGFYKMLHGWKKMTAKDFFEWKPQH